MGDMETKQTKWEELSISNDFLFGKVMQNPELCKELLQRILPDLNIERIEYPELQKSINMDMDARSVRLDYSDKIIIPIFKSINLNLAIAVPCPA